MRKLGVILLLSAATVSAASGSRSAEVAAQWGEDGRFHFFACEFMQAVAAFEKAVPEQPDSAVWHYRLGKSYARLAELSGPLFARKNARKAQDHLEHAVKLGPQNDEYLQELLDFCVASPEWFGGGGALLERISPAESSAELRLKQLADSRKEHSGVAWRMRWAVLRLSTAIGYLVPQRLP